MRSFYKLTWWTLVAVYVLILVGGIVRSTGSGMGCPDWPKCFGSWVPPTDVTQLPENYKEVYSGHREKKNIRFARMIAALGMKETAEKILNNKEILEEADFNVVKTWVEYVNRLVGVVIGFLIFAVFVSSLRFRKISKSLVWISLSAFLLVGFQGWLGSIVVSTNLTPWTITVHMFLALVIVAILIVLVEKGKGTIGSIATPLAFWWLLACMAVLLVQVLLGTQVREAVDAIAVRAARVDWIANLGAPFILHRSFSWIVLILHVGLILNLRKTPSVKAFSLWLIVLILGTLFTGLGMAYFAVPPWLQPLHLLLATVTFGAQFTLLLRINRSADTAPQGI